MIFRCVVAGFLLLAQSPSHAQSTMNTAHLSYNAPVTYQIGSKSLAIVNDMKCGSDGSVVLEADESGPTDPDIHFSLYLLSPEGRVIRFQSNAIPGFAAPSPPSHFAVTSSRIYAMVRAEKIEPGTNSIVSGYRDFILEFDYKGGLHKTIPLEIGLNPLSFAVFESGQILVPTLDKFNNQVKLTVIDESGSRRYDLSLFDASYNKAIEAAGSTKVPDAGQYIWRLISTAQFIPYGENLILAPINSALPLLEINEHGVLKSMPLSLPKGRVLTSMIPSTSGNWLATVGTVRYASDSLRVSGDITALTDPGVIEFSPVDGSIVSVTALSKDLSLVCKRDQDFIFYTTRSEDDRLQVVRGRSGK